MTPDEEKALSAALADALKPLSFEPDTAVPLGSEDISFWFSRPRHGTEAVACRVKRKPPFLVVQCFVSEYSLPELARRGAEDNAAGYGLEQYQVHALDRDPDAVLPDAIPLTPGERTWDDYVRSLAERIAAEIRSVDDTIWDRLRAP